MTPTNSVSVSPKSATFCGGYQFSISSVVSSATQALTPSELTIDSTGTIKLYTTNANAVGTHTATVTVTMTNYPTITLTATFTITIAPCQVTSLTMSALSPQSYTIGDPILSWSITGTTVVTQVPACNYNY